MGRKAIDYNEKLSVAGLGYLGIEFKNSLYEGKKAILIGFVRCLEYND